MEEINFIFFIDAFSLCFFLFYRDPKDTWSFDKRQHFQIYGFMSFYIVSPRSFETPHHVGGGGKELM